MGKKRSLYMPLVELGLNEKGIILLMPGGGIFCSSGTLALDAESNGDDKDDGDPLLLPGDSRPVRSCPGLPGRAPFSASGDVFAIRVLYPVDLDSIALSLSVSTKIEPPVVRKFNTSCEEFVKI